MAVPENVREQIITQIPVGRLGYVEEMAEAVSYLISEKSGFYNRWTAHVLKKIATLVTNLVTSKDTELVYPNKGKETVILLHGGPGVPEEVGLLAAFLSQEFQVIYFHQRGTLKSPCPPGDFSMASYISDIDHIAAHFKLQKFHLFGHSWGGLYAPIYAAQRQDKILSIFLCSPASGTGRQWVEMGKEIGRYNRKRSTFFEWLTMNINALLGILGSTNGYKITVTYGDDDLYGHSAEYVRERYPTADFVTISGCGHNQWLHNEKEFFATLTNHYNISSSA